MTRLNTIADAMSAIKNASDTGKSTCVIEPASKLIGAMLGIMKENGYISGFEYVEDGRGGHFVIGLNGSINRCGAINPRFSVTLPEMEDWETRYLPAKNFGILLMSTSKGVMSHQRARELGVGGELLAYVY
ncbi:MAG: 30S ribosomal protein S8 [Methanomicrobiales archaeon]|nr:30S ribosomal protein S8 [Methanomicrobiales archaeon]